jgi:hypothetical protein
MIASRYAAELLAGPPRRGLGLGHGYVLFGDDVLALTPPGAARMPNGIETDVRVGLGDEVIAGGGVLRTPSGDVSPSSRWDARPRPQVLLAADEPLPVEPEALVGWGPGLTPLGDDILIGFVAGRALAGRRVPRVAAAGTTALSHTLFACAARGELPEPAHALLEDGDPAPLLAFGATSGRGLIVGLALASGVVAARPAFRVELPMPGGARTFAVAVERVSNSGVRPGEPDPMGEPAVQAASPLEGPDSGRSWV